MSRRHEPDDPQQCAVCKRRDVRLREPRVLDWQRPDMRLCTDDHTCFDVWQRIKYATSNA